ncbi:unnamed protein product [Caenorhabditis auriculariae]|uniref:Uncharacterized protein n=1 Tax=Caenorhabditis auriculariae TaxID=2777116 RepID=A0A8S1HY67_9PELO|nr:unnamed protein product [Caenorhabditis auriculariae]
MEKGGGGGGGEKWAEPASANQREDTPTILAAAERMMEGPPPRNTHIYHGIYDLSIVDHVRRSQRACLKLNFEVLRTFVSIGQVQKFHTLPKTG